MTTTTPRDTTNRQACNSTAGFCAQDPSTLCTASRHDTLNAYNTYGCRCDAARAVRSRDEKRRRLDALQGRTRLVDATGTHRRLRALMAIGWRARDLAPRIGWPCGELDTLFRRPTVRRRTAENVAQVYLELSDRRGPSEQTRRRAARSGWLPPLWWDDDTIDDPTHDPQTPLPVGDIQVLENTSLLALIPDRGNSAKDNLVDGLPCQPFIDAVAIERAISGDRSVTLTRAEKTEAVRQLLADRHNVTDTAHRLHMSGRYVRVYAARAGIEIADPSQSAGTISATPTAEEATA